MPDSVHLLVHVPEASRYMLAKHDFPVLVYVDPPTADITCTIEGSDGKKPSYKVCKVPYGSFNAILRIRGLTGGTTYVLNVHARKDSHEVFACHSCRIRRDPLKRGFGGTPTITYPPGTNPVNTSFSAYGYVDPTTAAVTCWLADSAGNTYPGNSMNPPSQYDWAAGFAGIPRGSYTLYAQANGGTAQLGIQVGPA